MAGRWAIAILLACGTAACDDDPPTTPDNRAPQIAITASGSFGIAQLTTFVFTASVADPDGNPVTVTWSFGDGTSSAGTTVWKRFSDPGTIEAVATVKDHLGVTAASNVLSVTVGSVSGTWSGTVDLTACEAGSKPVTAELVQTGSTITGTVSLPEGLCSSASGSAAINTAEPGQMLGSGAARFRVVIPPAIDVSFEGQMDTTGLKLTGTLQGTDPSGLPFTLEKQ